MTRTPCPILGMGCAALLVAIMPVLRASDAPADPGYHNVKIQTGGQPAVVRVKDSIGPRLHGEAPSNGTYNPENMDLGRTSTFSNKSFSSQNVALSKSDTAAEANGDHPFQTKAFSGFNSDSSPGLDRKYSTSTFTNPSHENDGFQKSFATTSSKITQDKTAAFATKTSDFQGHTADLGAPKETPFAGVGFSDMNDKTFDDPMLKHVKRDPFAAANGLDVANMVNLPNRTLTIDEVRNLINHETIPNLDTKPEPASKPLNDPDYEPPTVAPMRGDTGAPGPEEKDGGLPSPGMMAAPSPPENAEPLPK